MAYSALPAKVASDTISLTNYDAIKGNFEAGVPDIFTTKGDLPVATGVDAAARLAVGANNAELIPDSTQATGLAWQIRPVARAYNNAAIALSAGAWTTLTLNSERTDTDGMHSTSTNTSRLTVPSGGAGQYLIGAHVEFDSSAIGVGLYVAVRILLNGATTIARATLQPSFGDALDATISLLTLYPLAVADYVEMQAYSTQALNVLASGNYSPEFWALFERR